MDWISKPWRKSNIITEELWYLCHLLRQEACYTAWQSELFRQLLTISIRLSSNTWYIPSIPGISTNGYLVTSVKDNYAECMDSMLYKKGECKHLCRHMYLCCCYDYHNGHLCKHINRVHSSIGPIVPQESDESDNSTEQQNTQLNEPMDDGSNKGHTPAVEIETEATHAQSSQHRFWQQVKNCQTLN